MLATAEPPTNPFIAEQWMVAQTFWIFTHVLTGRITVEDGFERFDAMLDAAPDRFAIASVCGFAATTAVALGAWDLIDRYSRISLEADPGSQFAFWGGQSLMQAGIVQAWRGETEAGIATFAEGRARYLGIGGPVGVQLVRGHPGPGARRPRSRSSRPPSPPGPPAPSSTPTRSGGTRRSC